MIFDDKTNKIERNVDKNTMEIYDHNDGNSSSNSRHLELINLSINNRSSHSEQLTKSVVMIQSVFDNAKIDDVLRY